MAKKKTDKLTDAERSFFMALRMLGISLTIPQGLTAYRLATYSRQKDGDISLKEVYYIHQLSIEATETDGPEKKD